MSAPDPQVTAALDRVRGASGRAFWRGLDELMALDGFRERLAIEFPSLAKDAGDWRRRDILKCLGGAVALAGLDGCERAPDEEALPYVVQPEGETVGVSRYYATAVELDGVAQPVLGKTREGRPIKLEGNPDHPASAGATDAFTQAALLGLYDPDRSATPLHRGRPADWDGFDEMMVELRERLDRSGGTGFRLLTSPVSSPTLLGQIATITSRWRGARWHAFSAVADRLAEATRAAFGRPLDRRLDLARAEVVVALGDDPLGPGPFQTAWARGWAERRLAHQQGEGAALLFVAEASPTLTGVTATDRLVAGEERIPALLTSLANALGAGGVTLPLTSRETAWVEAATRALAAHRGTGLVTVGSHLPPQWQQFAWALNGRLGALGSTLAFAEPSRPAPPDGDQSLAVLARDMRAGRVDTLLALDANPLYHAPPDLGFGPGLKRVPLVIHAGLHADETARFAHWHAPLTHALESWSDTRAAEGTASLIQPLVRPWLPVRSRHAVLGGLLGETRSDRDIVAATWTSDWGEAAGERWERALLAGLIPGSAPPVVEVAVPPPVPLPVPGAEGLTLLVRPDPTIWDGSLASNPWLQECPKPLSKLTWGNAVHISPALARERGLANGDVVRLSAGGRSVRGPVWVLPGQERRTVLVHLGGGRSAGGRVAQGVGFDAGPLRTTTSPWQVAGATIEPTGEIERLASTQTHFAMAGHDFVKFVASATARLPEEPQANFYPPLPSGPRHSPQWGMSIDLDLCIGCNACVVACVAENNIPMVGQEQVAKGREMHWIRVDQYHEGDPDDPRHVFQPVPCMHCEDAPCEMGCPVNATVHSPDGLNLQVYNRCIGTRTCAAYCPYKVRRFNWFDLTSDDPPPLKAVRNPDVTVRTRGVMEKCTYCIQRIEEERIDAKVAGRPMGKVTTACEGACPTRAIVFGDITDPQSEVSKRKAAVRDYSLLKEANTRPRTTYLARIEGGEETA